MAVFALLAVGHSAVAADRAIEDVRGSRSNNLVSAEIALGCGMRYLDHFPRGGGVTVRVRLALSPDCQRELGGVRSELYRPRGGYMGTFDEVEFDAAGLGEATVTVRFQRPVGFKVRQGALLNLLEILVDTEANVWADPARAPPAPRVATADVPAVPAASATKPREPMRLLPARRTDNEYRFVINLATFDPGRPVDMEKLRRFSDRTVYTNDVQVGERLWKELRLGFFASEQQAAAALEPLLADWPKAWVSVADVAERVRAAEQPLDPAAVVANAAESGKSFGSTGSVSAVAGEETIALMAQARAALIDKDYVRSVRIYTGVLEDPVSPHRREAREFIGLAYEKAGQTAQARAEYAAFLDEFPDGTDAQRVRQRLAGLGEALPANSASASAPARAPSRKAAAEWELFGSVSQYYYRDVNKPRQDLDDFVSQSALLSQTNLVLQRRGKRIDLLGRVNAGYYYDMLGEPEGSGDQGLVSFAYLDISDQVLNLNARIGRQTSYTGGVLGRFDGLHLSYGWKPDLTVNITTGFPVDSPRYETETGRYFYGASVDLANVAQYWDLSFFTNLQQVDGISDREAAGAEARFQRERWNLVGLVDFDLSYSVLNSALFVGNWRANDRLTLNARFDIGATPFLTTRNALIGQSVTTIDALLETYSEGQVRRLARNRTAQSQMASIGMSASLTERFNLNSDITYSEIEATGASGGVAAVPGTGGQLYYTANLVGSSLLKPRDTAIVGVRYTTSDIATQNTLVFDLRYPMGDDVRINPRVAFSTRNNKLDDSDQWIVAPMLRLTYRWFRRSRIELELGGELSNRDLPPDPLALPGTELTEERSAYFMSLGYYKDF